MASSKIKGITIEISGNTTKLQDALKGVDKQVYSLNGDLKALNQALKLDPKNTELLAQKQEVLARNIQASKERLDTLKEAQRQMGDYNKLTDEQKESYNQLSLEIAKSENALKSMNEELKNTHKHDFTQLQEGLKKVGDVALDVSKKILKISAAIGAALTGVVAASVKSYAELEKAEQGSKQLFGKSFDIVKKNAASAYKSMGLSATQYYDQVNTYAVGLKNSLKGDTKKAAELANGILIAQADIVAATGANIDTVQNAFSAVMRGNYTMLDNLRLGIKGSKQGMKEVINKVNAWNKAHGKATHYQMENYADMEKALVDYVKMVGIAGTAQDQMAATISGSLTQMKAAWSNFLNGTGGAEELAETVLKFIENILKAVRRLMPSLLDGLHNTLINLMPDLVDILVKDVPKLAKQLKKAITTFIETFADIIFEQQYTIENLVEELIVGIVEFITDNLPIIIDAAITIVVALAKGIVKALPKIIPAVVECILKIVETITNNLDYIIDSAVEIVITLVETLIDNVDLIIEAGVKLIIGLAKGLIKAIPKLLEKVPEILTRLADAFKNGISKIFDVGRNLIEGLWEGIKSAKDWLWNKIKGFGNDVVDFFKDVFSIFSPSKVMEKEIGQNLGLGIAKGIDDTVSEVENAMSNLSSKVEESVNPTINPTANSNPLYITIDKFYNNREQDIERLAEELEFYRKNSALAKGGV